MPTPYKGLTIPLSSDLADGPKAFQDYTDSLNGSDVIKAILPAGSVLSTVASTAPAGWLMLDGALVAGAQTAWPNLWAVVPPAWRVGADLQLPDARGRTIVGVDPANVGMDAIGEKGGAGSVALAEANLPPHAHAQQGTVRSGAPTARHNHGSPLGGGSQFIVTNFAAGISAPAGSGASGASLSGGDVNDHAHDVTLSGPTGNGSGTASPVSVLQPFIAFNYIIKAA